MIRASYGLSGFAALAALLVLAPTLKPQDNAPVGATARCRDGSYSFSTHPCASRGGVAMVLAADKSLPPEEDSVPDPVKFTAAEARTHKGEVATVCGRVADIRPAASVPGVPTYFDLDQAYPNQAFSVVIWQADLPNFPQPLQEAYQGKRVCATGRIEASGGAARIVVRWPNSLRTGI